MCAGAARGVRAREEGVERGGGGVALLRAAEHEIDPARELKALELPKTAVSARPLGERKWRAQQPAAPPLKAQLVREVGLDLLVGASALARPNPVKVAYPKFR